MRLRAEIIDTKVVEATGKELDWLESYLTFDDDSKKFAMLRYNRANFDEEAAKLRLFDTARKTFPSGMLPLVRKAMLNDGERFELTDLRQTPFNVEPHGWTWLWEHQERVIKKLLAAKRGIGEVATGGGKTEIAFGLVRSVPCHWLFVVHRAHLVKQAAKRWLKHGAGSVGIIGEGDFTIDPARRFTCATFQSLYAGLKSKNKEILDLLGDVEGVIVDEAHTLPADSYSQVMRSMRRAYWRYGLTATAMVRGDRRSVMAIAALGPMLVQVTARELIDKGILAEPIIRTVQLWQRSDETDPKLIYDDLIVRSTERNSLIAEIAARALKPTIVFVRRIEHGKTLVPLLRKAGVKTALVWGEKKTREREQALQYMSVGEYDGLVCSDVFNEGIDIPYLNSVVLAGAGKSMIQTLQRIGRGMRSDKGKKSTFEVWDVNDVGEAGPERHSQDRVRAYTRQDFHVTNMDVDQFMEYPKQGWKT